MGFPVVIIGHQALIIRQAIHDMNVLRVHKGDALYVYLLQT
jgi:hypothetical protein